MRRSISLEDLGLATDAPKLTSLLFAKALSFEGKEAMKAFGTEHGVVSWIHLDVS